jgi:phosphomannomutase
VSEAPRTLRISHVGLRGVVGAGGLTARHVIDFASAFGTFLEPDGAVVIGRDPRASGVMLAEGVKAGLAATGHDVIDLGVVSTPVTQHAIRRLGGVGGISIGASHNAAEWNALKFLGRNGTYLSTAEASELLDIYHLRRFRFVDYRGIGNVRIEPGALDAYLEEIAGAYDFERLRRFKVVVDCCNGTSGLILRRMNERFGFSFILINGRVEGVEFAHEPNTSARTVGLQLAPLVKPLAADAGFLFDVDSDRVAIATEKGDAVSEEMVMPLIADRVLPRAEGKLIIANLSTTALLEEVAARHGGTVLRVPVGRQAAMDALSAHRPEQIALAGEGTGAVMLPRFRFVYDGITSMLDILSLMAEREQPISGILAGYPRYSMLKGQAALVSRHVPALLMKLQQEYADGQANTLDGLRVDWPDQWFHVRVSQTESIVRVIAERRGSSPRELFDAVMEQI